MIDPYDARPRAFLRRIDKDFRAMFELEEKAVMQIKRRWRERPWRATYIGISAAENGSSHGW